MKIIFMSSGGIGVSVLNALLQSSHEVVAVYTNSAKNLGRGQQLTFSEIHNIAKDRNIKVCMPNSFKNEDVKSEFTQIEHDIVVVVSYGFILPNFVIYGKYQAINLHPSNLPKWRGAAPIERCIENGDTYTEICTMFMTPELDAGNIIERFQIKIESKTTACDIYKIVYEKGGKMIISALDKIQKGECDAVLQNGDVLYAKKIQKSELELNLHEIDANMAYNKIRAFSNYGYSYIIYNNERIKIIAAEMENKNILQKDIGKIDENFNLYLKNGIIKPIIVQRQGKNQIKIEDFLRGWKK